MRAVVTEKMQYTPPYCMQLYKIWLLEVCIRWLLHVSKEESFKTKQKVKRLDWNFVLCDFLNFHFDWRQQLLIGNPITKI